MKEVRYSTKARKDLKRYHPHMLSGNYNDCMECHVGSDFLLIWIDKEAIYVERVGSHAELFGK